MEATNSMRFRNSLQSGHCGPAESVEDVKARLPVRNHTWLSSGNRRVGCQIGCQSQPSLGWLGQFPATVGVAIGVTIDNIGAGIAIGVTIGAGFGTALGSSSKNKDDNEK